jgi:protocatechuate 3,4-dioxygenase beta subunit
MLPQRQTNRLSVQGAVFVAAIAALPLVVVFAAGAPEVTNNANADAAVAVLSGRVTNDAGEPLADVRVRVAIPATDMRFVESSTDHKTLEAKTGVNGEYRLELPAITKPTTVAIDAIKPGYRKLAGTLMNGGDAKKVEVAPGVVAKTSFALKPSLYLKGVVVDEQGKPVPAVKIGANATYARASDSDRKGTPIVYKIGGVERTASNPDGSFELFNYSVKPFADGDNVAKGTVGFFHPDYVAAAIKDVYALSQDQREALRIVLPTGYKISGRVLDIAGKTVSNVMIEATRENGAGRKATMTDANGRFVLRGLVKGPTTLRVHALELKQTIKLPITLDSDKSDLEVRLQAISLPTQPKAVAVLGMQLTDITPELQAAYDLGFERGALILDPGKDSERLKIGHLVEGYNFSIVGEEHIGSVREFINQILAEAATQDTDEYSVRVVYDFSTLDFHGTNTQYLKLTKDDVKQLRKALAELTDK